MENLNSGPPGDILSKHFLEMSRSDYRSLSGRNFLNDKIINEYFQLIRERNVREKLPTIYQLSTYAHG